jgi:hypothetical protein
VRLKEAIKYCLVKVNSQLSDSKKADYKIGEILDVIEKPA